MSDSQPAGTSFTRRLDYLFRTVHPRDGGEYSYAEVARGIGELTGVSISKAYVHHLRTGRADNPTKRHLEGLAAFFGVPVAYFFDDALAARIDGELDLLLALRDPTVRCIALRAHQASPEIASTIAELLRTAQRLEAGHAAGQRPAADPLPPVPGG